MGRREQAHGKPCPYCDRPMVVGHHRLAPTWDHVVPVSRGGRAKIVCCSQCNRIKGDMMPEEWAAYMGRVPMWWTMTPKERRAMARGKREEVRTAKWGPRRPRQGSPPPGPVVVPPALIYGTSEASHTPDPLVLYRLYGRPRVTQPEWPPETAEAAPSGT